MSQQVTSKEHKLLNWSYYFKESCLSSSQKIDKISEECKLFRGPNIIFGDTELLIKQQKSGMTLKYNAQESLYFINHLTRKEHFTKPEDEGKANTISYIPQKLQIKHAKHWQGISMPKNIEINELEQTSDSFFITPFKGRLEGTVKVEKVKDAVIPIAKLGPTNPIMFYNQGTFYEDELDDNGLIQYDYKFRTMANSWFALIRCYARIDDVAILILDTRIYWEQGWSKIARQFMVKKSTWSELKDKGYEFGQGWTMNPNQSHVIYEHLKEELVDNQYIHFE